MLFDFVGDWIDGDVWLVQFVVEAGRFHLDLRKAAQVFRLGQQQAQRAFQYRIRRIVYDLLVQFGVLIKDRNDSVEMGYDRQVVQ